MRHRLFDIRLLPFRGILLDGESWDEESKAVAERVQEERV
jgi:hypothetical protein